MISYVENIADFFIANFPSTKALVMGGPMALLWAVACLMFAGFMKTRWNWKMPARLVAVKIISFDWRAKWKFPEANILRLKIIRAQLLRPASTGWTVLSLIMRWSENVWITEFKRVNNNLYIPIQHGSWHRRYQTIMIFYDCFSVDVHSVSMTMFLKCCFGSALEISKPNTHTHE